MIPYLENTGEAARMDAEKGVGAAALMNVEEVLTKPVHSPFGVQKIYTARRAAPSLLVDVWMDGRGIKSVL